MRELQPPAAYRHAEARDAGAPRRMTGPAQAVALRGSLALAPQGDGEHHDGDAAAQESVYSRRAGAVRGCLSRPAPLFAQLGPVFEPLLYLALETALRRIVELAAAERFGEIILAGKRLRRVVIVFVTGAIAFASHQPGRRIEDVLGRQQRAGLFRGAHGLAESGIGGVRFRRGGDIDQRLRYGEFALRTAEKIVSVFRGVGDDERLRIGKPDIFDRH